MTDKVQKIREEVERLRNLHQIRYQHLNTNDNLCHVECGKRNLCDDLLSFIDSLQEEPVSEDLKVAADNALEGISDKYDIISVKSCLEMFRLGSEWSKKHLWKDAQGNELPEIDRDVIALLDNGKVVFAHRPYKGKYLGKNLTTGNIETFENKVYDKGGWNQPDVKWWLDIEKLPNMEE